MSDPQPDSHATAPLLITADVAAQLGALAVLAARHPVAVGSLRDKLANPEGKRRHLAQMERQTVVIPGMPWPFFVTMSVEHGHPVGTCLHMSMSVDRIGRVPHPAAAWLVAELLGFAGGLDQCTGWSEALSDGRVAANLVQPCAWQAAGGRA